MTHFRINPNIPPLSQQCGSLDDLINHINAAPFTAQSTGNRVVGYSVGPQEPGPDERGGLWFKTDDDLCISDPENQGLHYYCNGTWRRYSLDANANACPDELFVNEVIETKTFAPGQESVPLILHSYMGEYVDCFTHAWVLINLSIDDGEPNGILRASAGPGTLAQICASGNATTTTTTTTDDEGNEVTETTTTNELCARGSNTVLLPLTGDTVNVLFTNTAGASAEAKAEIILVSLRRIEEA